MNSCVLEPKVLDVSHALKKFNNLKIPEEARFRIPTMNRFGYMFTKFDPIVDRWLESVKKNPRQGLFEVGGAYGNVARAALEKGIEKYYLNDCEENHLNLFAQKLKEDKKDHLFSSLELILGRCPDDIKLRDNCLDAILVNKVLHFFTPDNVDSFVRWMRNGLKLGGLVYILTISPFYKGHEEILIGYEERKRKGDRFPGWCPSCEKMDIGKVYNPLVRPVSLLYMEMRTLKELLQGHDFQIVEEFDLAIINEKNPEWRPGKDMAGIIAKRLF
jgi:ubiquinone/menaquinone biosynthesis C-methylase UbiE